MNSTVNTSINLNGDKGCVGDKGPCGDRGCSGRDGLLGPTGCAGLNGLKGEPGAPGEIGRQGATGPTGGVLVGPQGPGGPAGRNGIFTTRSSSYSFQGPNLQINNNWAVPYGVTEVQNTGLLEVGDNGTGNWTNGWRCTESGVYFVVANAANQGGDARFVMTKGAGIFNGSGSIGDSIIAGGLSPTRRLAPIYDPGAFLDVRLIWCGIVISGEKICVLWSNSSNAGTISSSFQYGTPTDQNKLQLGVKYDFTIIKLSSLIN